VRAGGQQAVGCYLWDEQASAYVGRAIDVPTLRGARIAAVTAFVDATLVPRFGLPDAARVNGAMNPGREPDHLR
jgi:RNA polymerase sigma-70 factor (ECF subfamily)